MYIYVVRICVCSTHIEYVLYMGLCVDAIACACVCMCACLCVRVSMLLCGFWCYCIVSSYTCMPTWSQELGVKGVFEYGVTCMHTSTHTHTYTHTTAHKNTHTQSIHTHTYQTQANRSTLRPLKNPLSPFKTEIPEVLRQKYGGTKLSRKLRTGVHMCI